MECIAKWGDGADAQSQPPIAIYPSVEAWSEILNYLEWIRINTFMMLGFKNNAQCSKSGNSMPAPDLRVSISFGNVAVSLYKRTPGSCAREPQKGDDTHSAMRTQRQYGQE